ncbi:MAG: hypothetical protein IK094_09725, partial [Treponema sp.]|nr:hypothetical protein [Treponema sp.]
KKHLPDIVVFRALVSFAQKVISISLLVYYRNPALVFGILQVRNNASNKGNDVCGVSYVDDIKSFVRIIFPKRLKTLFISL